jgi:hypothetical protein
MYTRKAKRGGVFGFGSKNSVNSSTNALKMKRNYNLKHSKSRVANVLGAPGQIRYTNKERIESEYQKAISELRKLDKPVESASALRTVTEKVKTALESQEAREAGAVVITIPIGVAQLFLKVARVMLSAFVFLFWDIPTMGSIPLSPYVLPNKNFNTTKNVYNTMRKFTGANTRKNVVNYK